MPYVSSPHREAFIDRMKVRQELAHALYQHDASCRVIARLIKERDDSRQALIELREQVQQQRPNNAMELEERNEFTADIIQQMKDLSKEYVVPMAYFLLTLASDYPPNDRAEIRAPFLLRRSASSQSSRVLLCISQVIQGSLQWTCTLRTRTWL